MSFTFLSPPPPPLSLTVIQSGAETENPKTQRGCSLGSQAGESECGQHEDKGREEKEEEMGFSLWAAKPQRLVLEDTFFFSCRHRRRLNKFFFRITIPIIATVPFLVATRVPQNVRGGWKESKNEIWVGI